MKDVQNTWDLLQKHANEFNSSFNLKQSFQTNPSRFNQHSILLESQSESLLYDYSKNLFDTKTLDLLFQLARERNIESGRDAMFNGDAVNFTEGRAALHVALRLPAHLQRPEVKEQLAKMSLISDKIRSGKWIGAVGKPIKYVVNIGIGGSDLGPQFVCNALTNPTDTQTPQVFFVSNVDEVQLNDVLMKCHPEETLFVVVSKTFGTQETMHNAQLAKLWMLNGMGGAEKESVIGRHFIAISADPHRVAQFGVPLDNLLQMWDWVGGRYSVWSTVGLSVCISIGFDKFREFLDGAAFMDKHFASAPLEQNLPVIMALLGIWYNNFLNSQSICVVPYEQRLARMPAYLQQLEMESNGKSVDKNGNLVSYSTCPIVWGEPGTNGQHAFFQLLHQGTKLIPIDFLVGANSACHSGEAESLLSHQMLMANCLAQGEALMNGRGMAELKDDGTNAQLKMHRTFSGNRPSSTFAYRRLSPFTLGMILAAYEHKVFVQGCIWNVNSFDQWGVELGKSLADKILKEFSDDRVRLEHDSSTTSLLSLLATWHSEK